MLHRMCEVLDGSDVRELAWKDEILRDEQTSRLRITSVWVVGSYAKGSLDCGDLDLVLAIESLQGYVPSARRIAKSFFGALPRVRCYDGTPEKNSSNVAFTDAVLVWMPGHDWRTALDEIKPDPTAGRAARDIDALQLRGEQLAMDVEDLRQLVGLRDDGRLAWQFHSMANADLEPLVDDDISEQEGELLECCNRWLSKQSRQLAPAIVRFLRMMDPSLHAVEYLDQTSFLCGGIEFRLGRPAFRPAEFDRPNRWQVALVPHWSARGPNGILLLRRGLRHPLMLQLKGLRPFLSAEDDAGVLNATNEEQDRAKVLPLFTRREDAQEFEDGFLEEGEASTPVRQIANQEELLRAFATVDVVEVDGVDFPLTHGGLRYSQLKGLATIEQIAVALSRRA
jgi:predicted nucleotidyltransferase